MPVWDSCQKIRGEQKEKKEEYKIKSSVRESNRLCSVIATVRYHDQRILDAARSRIAISNRSETGSNWWHRSRWRASERLFERAVDPNLNTTFAASCSHSVVKLFVFLLSASLRWSIAQENVRTLVEIFYRHIVYVMRDDYVRYINKAWNKFERVQVTRSYLSAVFLILLLRS